MSTPDVLVSVIIPVFNGEEHLAECLASVSRQSYQRLEIIVVNDGSTDGTEQMLRSIEQKEPRITSIHCRNGGVSSARNAGLEAASGEWVMFVDADDMMSDRLLIETVVLAGEADVEMIWFESSSDESLVGDAEALAAVPGPAPSPRAEHIAARAHDFTLDCATLASMVVDERLNALWDKAYRRDAIVARECRFREGTRMGEDLLFNLAFARVHAAVRSIPITGYFYRRNNPESATNRYLPGKYVDLMAVSEHLHGWAQEVGAGELTGAADYIRAKNVISCIRDLHHGDCGLSRRDRLAAARYYRSQVPAVHAHGIGARRRLLGELYNLLGFRSLFHLTRLLARLR